MTNQEKTTIEIAPLTVDDQHGLCDTAETHWAVYLIELIRNGKKPTIHEAKTVDGIDLRFITKGEDMTSENFNFGADSSLIIGSSDGSLDMFLIVEEGIGTYVGRQLVDLSTSLQVNGYDDPNIQSKWKGAIAQFATEKKFDPKSLTLQSLVESALS